MEHERITLGVEYSGDEGDGMVGYLASRNIDLLDISRTLGNVQAKHTLLQRLVHSWDEYISGRQT